MNPASPHIGSAQSRSDLLGILRLQQQNLKAQLNSEQWQQEGFVTVAHTLPLLENMNKPYPHAIAKQGEEVVGYALVMLPEHAEHLPILAPMFAQFNTLNWQEKALTEWSFVVMGQVCIAKGYRGQGLFGALFQQLKSTLSADFSLLITEVATSNPRSLRAHHKIGFQTIHQYQEASGAEWEIVAWDWQ